MLALLEIKVMVLDSNGVELRVGDFVFLRCNRKQPYKITRFKNASGDCAEVDMVRCNSSDKGTDFAIGSWLEKATDEEAMLLIMEQ